MFRRYPYWGWLLLSIVLWGVNGYQFHMHRQAMLPQHMAAQVNNDLHHRNDAFEKFIGDRKLLGRLFADSLTDKEFTRVNGLPFFIYCYVKDTLVSWNTNIVTAGYSDTLSDKLLVLNNEKGSFLEKCIRPFPDDTSRKLVVLFPVLISYPLENAYLHSHFMASENIPVRTKILPPEPAVTGAFPVTLQPFVPAMQLQFDAQDLQKWVPDTLFIGLLIAALIASISWLQLMTIYFTRKTSPAAGFCITIGVIGALLFLYYYFGLPFNLESLTFFDAQLYASSRYLSSFGDLFINTLCLLWIVVFVSRHTPYKTYFERWKDKKIRYLFVVILIICLFAYVNLFVYVIRSLVRDSNISFDVSHFYAINMYTILGLLVIGGITGISCMVIFLFNLQLRMLCSNRWTRYLIVLLTGLALVMLRKYYHEPGTAENPFDWLFYWALFAWLLFFLFLLDMRNFSLVSDLFEPHMVFWAIFMCAFCTVLIQYFNEAKERDNRRAYVKNRLAPQRAYDLEISFDSKAKKIEHDRLIRNFLYKPTAQNRKTLDLYLNASYLADPSLNKYQPSIYLFDQNKKPLMNKDTATYAALNELKNESDPTNSPYLFYKESVNDLHQYLGYISIYNDTVNKIAGYVLVDLDLKKQVSGTVYPELLQTTGNVNTHDNEYAVAVYINDKLNSQTNNYQFPTVLTDDTLKKEDEYAFFTHHNVSELYYKISGKRTLVVIHYHSAIIELITLFSYLFVIQVLLACVILLYQLYLTHFTSKETAGKLLRLTLRKRVHFSMLAIVLLSFILIGFVTILFFKSQYQLSNTDKLQTALQVAKQSVQDDLKKEQAFRTRTMFDTVTRSLRFKSMLNSIASGQKTDLNIYNRNGMLVNTSEDDIYEKGLISRIMRPDAFYQLNTLGKSILIQDENVDRLSYLSAYLPVRDEAGVTRGYINVPFFSSEKDLNFQISNIVVTLINLYAFIFLISSLIAVLITRWITSSFNLIIKQFGMLNLQQNERINWPYDDEIGLLVNEYNKMVNKVEENAARLAQSERESAWREMARQVAHEIKNPLTPMKLNIQFLQQAMRNDHPGIKDLTEKVSVSIIEQIENLSYIASEFSNFAKMPEARPEIMDPVELLNLAVKLYLNDSTTHVTITEDAERMDIYSDKSQLLRVFMNLLENARQAIPGERTATIKVKVTTGNHEVTISIEDNGVGISEEIAEKIFQPYFTTKSSGTGLGLAMTKKIIEFWNGKIWYETREGEGTIFYVRLPLHVPAG